MSHLEFTMPTLEERAILEARAHELRAEAVRSSFVGFFRFAAAVPQHIRAVFQKTAHS